MTDIYDFVQSCIMYSYSPTPSHQVLVYVWDMACMPAQSTSSKESGPELYTPLLADYQKMMHV